ncbi:hypothetical protein M6B38_264210 [Iris pallida]|uniref:Uncharacterized protein n=1 Tax=Iris pallida TaxID=29817 RepID=A0AAX6ICC8_IRIPA|nr:hypothetical protein M6B38_264210 [Iris pallida]
MIGGDRRLSSDVQPTSTTIDGGATFSRWLNDDNDGEAPPLRRRLPNLSGTPPILRPRDLSSGDDGFLISFSATFVSTSPAR